MLHSCLLGEDMEGLVQQFTPCMNIEMGPQDVRVPQAWPLLQIPL